MGSVDVGRDRNFAVRVENEADAAQLRAAIKLSDGADEPAIAPGQMVVFSTDNPLNIIAIWRTEFPWTRVRASARDSRP
jgi:hypothetical protein